MEKNYWKEEYLKLSGVIWGLYARSEMYNRDIDAGIAELKVKIKSCYDNSRKVISEGEGK